MNRIEDTVRADMIRWGDFHLTISYVEREWEGEPYGEDYRLDEIEIVE